MNVYYDLHIHTALSPCSSDDMTPNNILNMSMLKELDVIAITDHNSTANCRACIELAKKNDILVIPGMELQTIEDVHILCLFRDVDSAEKFDEILDDYRMEIKKEVSKYGNQLILDREDNHVADHDYPLFISLNISIKKAIEIVEELDGVVVPAHVDRKSFSIISSLGFIPKDYGINSIEVSKDTEYSQLIKLYPYLSKYKYIKNSDAHDLFQISERENYIEIDKKEIDKIIEFLK